MPDRQNTRMKDAEDPLTDQVRFGLGFCQVL